MAEISKSTMRNLLREVKEVAEHASMTGSLKGGIPVLVDMYNKCLSALQEQGDDAVGNLFPELSKDKDTIDTIGASAALLYAYLAPECDNKRRKEFVYTLAPGAEADE